MAEGCCGKPKPGPHGGAQQRPKPEKPSTSMTGQTQSFRLNLAGGETVHVNGSMLEAQATLTRLGGQGTISF